MKSAVLLILSLLLSMPFAGCYYDVEEELYPSGCDTSSVTYSQDIKPIMDAKCNKCHATGSSLGAGIVLDTYAGLSGTAQSGRLLGAVRHESGYKFMPKNENKLDDCSILKLEIWVADGSPDN